MTRESHSSYKIPSADEIRRYGEGKLSPERAHEVERFLEDSPWGESAAQGWAMDPKLEGLNTVNLPTQKANPLAKLGYVAIPVLIVAAVFVWSNWLPETTAELPTSRKIDKVLLENATERQALLLEDLEEKKEIQDTDGTESLVIQAESTDSSFSFMVESTELDTESFSEELIDPFMQFKAVEAPETISPLEVPEEVAFSDSTQSEPRLLRRGNKIYHIKDFKVVDYRGLRRAHLEREDLSSSGTPASRNTESNILQHLLEQDQADNRIAYVDWLEYAMVAFAQDRFSKATSRFSVILNDFPDDANALFYKGMAQFYQQEYSSAIALFQKSLASEIVTFHEESAFYLAESFKANGQVDEAQNIFKKIIEKGGFYAERAKKEMD